MRRHLLILLAAALVLSGCSGFGTPAGYTVQAEIPRTFNLFPGSPVRILGIESGLVEELDVEPGADMVTATLRIDEGVELPADVRAFVLTDSLLGERVVQLDPPYQDGPQLEDGAMLAEPASVPAEFDELLEALNDFVVGMKDGDLPRLVDNLAELLDGNGERIGSTLENLRDGLEVVADHDQTLLELSSDLADLSETLNTRRDEIIKVVQDFAEVSQVLADQRDNIDRALGSLSRLADEGGRLLEANREVLERDIAILARLTRTTERNLDHVSSWILHSAELFLSAERVVDREHKWLPLVNQTDLLGEYLLAELPGRLAGLCERDPDLPADTCDALADTVESLLAGDGVNLDDVCLEGLIPCTNTTSSGETYQRESLREVVPDVMDQSVEQLDQDGELTEEERQQLEGIVEGVTEQLTGPLGGGDQ